MEKAKVMSILGDYIDDEPPKARIVVDAKDDGTGSIGVNMEIDGRGDIVLYGALAVFDSIAEKLGKVRAAGLLTAYADQLLHEGMMSQEAEQNDEFLSFEDDDTDEVLS